MAESKLRIGLIYPQVLGTYGDSGNAVILAERARRRGIDAEIVTIGLDQKIPSELDLYALGGGEDTAQAIAADRLRSNFGLREAARKSAPILAICASLQVLGLTYTDALGNRIAGVGLIDAVTVPMGGRAIGELIEAPLLEGLTEPLTGFENHGGATTLGLSATPLGKVLAGTGNGGRDGISWSPEGMVERPVEGAVQGSIIGTYLHGPVLARNPQLADYLLARSLGVNLEDLDPLDIPGVERLRAERLSVLTKP